MEQTIVGNSCADAIACRINSETDGQRRAMLGALLAAGDADTLILLKGVLQAGSCTLGSKRD
jgi:hypothetical protein